MIEAPLSIVWPCRLSVEEYAAAGKGIEVPRQACPGCTRPLSFWSGYERPVRCGRDLRIWVRRARCEPCAATHALLPDFVVDGRYDSVDVIGPALAKGSGGLGMRKVAEQAGVPHSTARDWRRRHRARAPALIQHFTELVLRLGGEVGAVSVEAEQAALELVRAAWRAATAGISDVWRFWNAVCGGRALDTNTSPPLLAMWKPVSMPI